MVTATPAAEAKRCVLRLRGVSKFYGSGNARQTALDRVSLDILPGSFTALVGQSGSGKSTLLNVAGGLEPTTYGEVIVAGRPIQDLGPSAATAYRAKTVSYVFQEWNLIRTMTVLENVCLPLELAGASRRAARERALEVLALVDVRRHFRKFPDQLSGGEQQRVAIARALADRRPLLLADEPTGALDSENGQIVVTLLRQAAAGGVACVVATHNPDIAEAADRLIHMKDGRIVEGGGS
jgi:putative ABC transport system ATP-binding protein